MATLDINLIFVEILPKLPAKSLIRFKSVSKLFQSTISSREFAGLYLRHRSLSSSDHDYLVFQENCLITFYDLDSRIIATSLSPFTWNESSYSFATSGFVVGSTNGLVCTFIVASYSDEYFAVYNPYTRMVTFAHFSTGSQLSPFGFAFDRFNLDHKIVTISDVRYDVDIRARITRVYSLNTDIWTTIPDVKISEDSLEGRQSGALINHHLLHWVFRNPSKEARIGCFDVCKMKWRDNVLLPRHCYDLTQKDKVSLLDFGVFDGCLFLLFENRADSRFDVWFMKEYGVQESWLKFLSISNDFAGGMVPVTYHGGPGESLIRQRQSSRLYWYNTTSGGIKEADFNEAPDFGNHQVYTCSRSLVGIPRGTLY